MLETRVRIVNELGLHARAAAKLLHVAEAFQSDIKLVSLDETVTADAKSILSVLSLAASKGTELILRIEGGDEENAFEAVGRVFENGFGEL